MQIIGYDTPEMIKSHFGKFSIVHMNVWGPPDYLEARGNDLLTRITHGKDLVFRQRLACAKIDPETGEPDFDAIMLERLQSDYLAWKCTV